MEITYHGAGCIVINNKKTRLVVDDYQEQFGLNKISKEGDILLLTGGSAAKAPPREKAKFIVDSPGEYEISGASIRGIQARAHTDEDKEARRSIIYKIIINDTRVAILGNVYPELSDSQLEDIGTVDILFIPVGGNGYTLDGTGAIGLIRKIEPKIVVPVHYADSKTKYPVPQAELEKALKEMSMEIFDTQESLKNKGLETIENTRLIVLKRRD